MFCLTGNEFFEILFRRISDMKGISSTHEVNAQNCSATNLLQTESKQPVQEHKLDTAVTCIN